MVPEDPPILSLEGSGSSAPRGQRAEPRPGSHGQRPWAVGSVFSPGLGARLCQVENWVSTGRQWLKLSVSCGQRAASPVLPRPFHRKRGLVGGRPRCWSAPGSRLAHLAEWRGLTSGERVVGTSPPQISVLFTFSIAKHWEKEPLYTLSGSQAVLAQMFLVSTLGRCS